YVKIKHIPNPDLGPDKSICRDDVIILFPGGFDGKYLWQDGSTNVSYRVTTGGLYKVRVNNQCGAASDDITIRLKDCKLYWPTAFTPNNDGKNDVFKALSNASFKKFNLQVFNRWGELIYHTSNASQGWNGEYKGVPQLAGTYVWSVDYIDNKGVQLEDKGVVILVR
ncbi:MAG: gliding motility-associated C-terminal domain-containing protein, partial [Pedobacter sp.]